MTSEDRPSEEKLRQIIMEPIEASERKKEEDHPRHSWRHPHNYIKAARTTIMFLALLSVSFALYVTNQARNDLQGELKCRSNSAVGVDQATAEELAANGVGVSMLLDIVASLSGDDTAKVHQLITLIPDIQDRLDMTSKQLFDAVEARSAAIKGCG